MAPKKRKSSEVSPNRDLVIKSIARTEANRRITRSLTIKQGAVSSSPSPTTRRSSSSSAARKQASSASASASKKKGKKPMTKEPPKKKLKTTPKKADDDDEAKSVSLGKTSDGSDDDDDDVKKSDSDAASDNDDDDGVKGKSVVGGSSSSSKTTIIIEHCKKCSSFKKRANEARAGLEKSIPGINVLINPDKPREGCFEIRAEDGKAFVSLLDMKRPYKAMKDLDMDEVVADIVKEIGE